MEILTAYDNSPEAKTALQDLQGAGLPTADEITLLSVAYFFIRRSIPESPYSPDNRQL